MLTRWMYTTKAEKSVSKQGHLQPRRHSKARSLSIQLQKWSIHQVKTIIKLKKKVSREGGFDARSKST